MVVTRRQKEEVIIALTNRKDALSLLKALEDNTVAYNAMVDSYTALLAKLNIDTGVALTNYGSGTEAPPAKL